MTDIYPIKGFMYGGFNWIGSLIIIVLLLIVYLIFRYTKK